MTKHNDHLVTYIQQTGLFDLFQCQRVGRDAFQHGTFNIFQHGTFNISSELNAAIKKSIRLKPTNRESIADKMTELLGIKITDSMLNNYTAESHRHRIPAEFVPAFCIAANTLEPIRVLAEAAGVFTVCNPDSLRADIQNDEDELKVRQQNIRKKVALLEALEARK